MGPFTTLSTFARKVLTSSQRKTVDSFIIIDSIGFIEDLNPLLLNAFHTTLSELANSDLILLFIDGSDKIEIVKRKVSTARKIMDERLSGVPVIICINKIDIATRKHLDKVLEETRRIFTTEEILEVSSKTGVNLPELLCKITEMLAMKVPNM
jgi:GTP-binding protein HflX